MKFRTLLIAASLVAGAGAFAAAPNDTANTPAKTGSVVKHSVKHSVKQAKMHARYVKHVAKREVHKERVALNRHNRHHAQHTAAVPRTSVTDQSRESRMDQALSNFRRSHG